MKNVQQLSNEKQIANMQTMGERVIIVPNKKIITKENKVPR